MKLKTGIIIIFISLLFVSCGNKSNNEAFISQTTGRYLFNSDEIIEVYFNNGKLFLKWRGATAIEPLKIDENIFFVKEMNEKIQFLNNPADGKTYIILVPKEESQSITYNFRKLSPEEKTPSEYLSNNEFDKAVDAYLSIQENDSLDPSINEGSFNSLGYQKLRAKNYKEAKEIFKINMMLYPESSNVYDSYAEVLRKSGDTLEAIIYYKKSVELDSGNKNAKNFIEKYDKN